MFFYKTIKGEVILKSLTIVSLFFVTPFLIRIFGVEQYGIYMYCLSLISFLSLLQSWGSVKYAELYYTLEGKATERQEILGNSYLITACSSFVLLAGVFLSYAFGVKTLFNIPIFFYIPMLLLGAFMIIPNMLIVLSQYQQFINQAYFLKIFINAVNIISVGVLYIYNLSVEPFLWLMALVNLLILIISIYASRTFSLQYTFSVNKYKKKYAIIVSTSLLVWTMAYIDRFFILEFLNKEKLSIYVAAFSLSFLAVNFLFSFIRLMIKTKINDYMRVNNDTGIISVELFSGLIVSLVILPISLGLSLYGKSFVTLYAGQAYIEAHQYILLLSAGCYISALSYFYRETLISYNKNNMKYVFIVTILSALIVIMLNALLIPLYGLYGSAIANMAGYFFYMICFVVKYAHNYKRWGVILLLCKIHSVAFLIWFSGNALWSDSYGLLSMLLFCIVSMLVYWLCLWYFILRTNQQIKPVWRNING